ncbi:MAG: hypothetical protein KKA81_02470 [Bacteroidetes bacterium]|nr:hypothetical protein [Bacteroidota bacterium]
MTDKSGKILKWVLSLILAVSAVMGLLFYMDVIADDLLIYWGYILVIITAVITIIFPLVYLLLNLKSSVKFLLILALLVVLGIVSYAFSGNEFTALQLEKMEVTADTSRWVGAGLIFTYILAGLTVISIVYASISRIFK